MTTAATPYHPLTDRQREVLDYIRSATARRGFAPTLREIGAHFGFASPNAVLELVRRLERKGYLTHDRKVARSFRLTEQPAAADPALSVLRAVLGRIGNVPLSTYDDPLPLSTRLSAAEAAILGRLAGGGGDPVNDGSLGSCCVCGAGLAWVECWICDGDAVGDWGDDCFCCDGAGGWSECPALPHTVEQVAGYREVARLYAVVERLAREAAVCSSCGRVPDIEVGGLCADCYEARGREDRQ